MASFRRAGQERTYLPVARHRGRLLRPRERYIQKRPFARLGIPPSNRVLAAADGLIEGDNAAVGRDDEHVLELQALHPVHGGDADARLIALFGGFPSDLVDFSALAAQIGGIRLQNLAGAADDADGFRGYALRAQLLNTRFSPALTYVSAMALIGVFCYIFVVGTIERLPDEPSAK